MKKTFIVTICLSFLFVLSACNKEAPQELCEQHIQYGTKLIDIADSYIEYELTTEEAIEKLDILDERCPALDDFEPSTDDYFAASTLSNCTARISLALNAENFEHSSKNYSTIVEYRNMIAELIGAEKR